MMQPGTDTLCDAPDALSSDVEDAGLRCLVVVPRSVDGQMQGHIQGQERFAAGRVAIDYGKTVIGQELIDQIRNRRQCGELLDIERLVQVERRRRVEIFAFCLWPRLGRIELLPGAADQLIDLAERAAVADRPQ